MTSGFGRSHMFIVEREERESGCPDKCETEATVLSHAFLMTAFERVVVRTSVKPKGKTGGSSQPHVFFYILYCSFLFPFFISFYVF